MLTNINQNFGGVLDIVWISYYYYRYTLRNAEYRLCLERNFDVSEENLEKQTSQGSKVEMLLESANLIKFHAKDELSPKAGEVMEDPLENLDIQGLGEVSQEVQQYILHLQAHLSSAKKVCNSIDGIFH